jgi:hypothetical protein
VNKHVPQPHLADQAKSANKTASSIRGGEGDVKAVPPPKPAQGKSPPSQQPPEKPQSEKPRVEKPQIDEPQHSESDARTPGATRDRISLASILGALIVGAFLWWSWGSGGS